MKASDIMTQGRHQCVAGDPVAEVARRDPVTRAVPVCVRMGPTVMLAKPMGRPLVRRMG